jgi:hypothetical protein
MTRHQWVTTAGDTFTGIVVRRSGRYAYLADVRTSSGELHGNGSGRIESVRLLPVPDVVTWNTVCPATRIWVR